MLDNSLPLIDPRQVRRGFARAAAGYDAAALLPREIAARMLERLNDIPGLRIRFQDCVQHRQLDEIKIQPGLIIDLGCGTGASLTALGERYPHARVLGLDMCEAMLRVGNARHTRLRWLLPFLRGPKRAAMIAADTQALPLRAESAGFVWSNLMLHWLADPLAGLREMHRVLEVGGLLMFSTFGPDTLKELRACFSDGYEHTLRFIDMHDYGDMLTECGFADPVMDAERLTLTYPSSEALFDELRRSGSTCAAPGRRRGLLGRQAWRAVREAYERCRVDGRLPASFEVVYGHAWKAEPRTVADGRAVIRFASLASRKPGSRERNSESRL